MLNPQSIEHCKTTKNLLAFSAGIDSTALFFLLLEADIPFDLAMVDYAVRDASKAETAYAQELADHYGKTLYLYHADPIESDFEHEARKIRYNFFESLIESHAYQTLLTAHQLNDRLEWLLMQLSKGSGLVELLGMQALEKRHGYTLVRPLLAQTKAALKSYLETHQRRYFIDESNSDPKFKRNRFRTQYSDPLLETYTQSIKESFDYLDLDRELLIQEIQTTDIEALTRIDAPHQRALMIGIDRALKKRGYLLSSAQRAEIIKQKSIVIATQFVVELKGSRAYIAPSIEATMPKYFKERCRIKQIPLKLRPYLFTAGISLDVL